ncbi:MAG: hypothetical protein ABI361_04350 [Nitrososphaera sp.]|jgi:hypothetical protein
MTLEVADAIKSGKANKAEEERPALEAAPNEADWMKYFTDCTIDIVVLSSISVIVFFSYLASFNPFMWSWPASKQGQSRSCK